MVSTSCSQPLPASTEDKLFVSTLGPNWPDIFVKYQSTPNFGLQFSSDHIDGRMMPSVNINLPAVPAELKTISPYISRAQELKGKDPVIAYYCLFHAVQIGIGIKTEREGRNYLNSLMNTLETMKEQLKDRDEITSDEAAAPYVEKFALKVFTNADNEDRSGGSNRSTAKKFLAASNFFELLTLFDKKYLDPKLQANEKIKYAKWKAADIAKAFREGRVPKPGPATIMDASEDEYGERHSDFEDMSMGSSAAKQPTSTSSKEGYESSSVPQATAKPNLPPAGSSSSLNTVAHTGPPLVPQHISTLSNSTSHYVVDVSSPSPVDSTGTKTPIKSLFPSDGQWSTTVTPGLDSPNFGSSWGKLAFNPLSPTGQALFNPASKGGVDESLSPDVSLKPKSGLGATVVSASDVGGSKPSTVREPNAEDGTETDEDDGQWSTTGNDPFSRQNSMVPLHSDQSFHRVPPGLVVRSNLDAVYEEVPQKRPLTEKCHNLATPGAPAAPLQPSGANSAASSPENRPGSVSFAASHPLPPLLPPATKAPSSIKSESHALPTTGSDEVYKHSIVDGESTSDGEASYNVRQRAYTTAVNNPKPEDDEQISAHHARSSSTNTAARSEPPSSIPTNQPSVPFGVDEPLPDDDWERVSLGRLARLPDNRSGSEMDSLSGRLRGLGTPPDASSSTIPTLPTNYGRPTEESDFKSRRNTIRAGEPRPSSSDFGFRLPGVPSAPPLGDWNRRGGGSDSGGEGEVMAKLPSAPDVSPLVQDQLPHVSVFHKPASPQQELLTNTPSSAQSMVPPTYMPTVDGGSSTIPRSSSRSRAPSASSGGHGFPTQVPPPPTQYGQPHLSTASPSNAASSIHSGHTPPNSVVTPHPSHSDVPSALPPSHYAVHYGQLSYTHAPVASPPSHYTPVNSTNVPQAFYATSVQPHGVNGSHDEYRLGLPARPPPTELDPETIGKAQRHTKFALSALNFEDLETAREELKKALRLLS